MFEKIKNSYMKMYNSKLKKMKGKKQKRIIHYWSHIINQVKALHTTDGNGNPRYLDCFISR